MQIGTFQQSGYRTRRIAHFSTAPRAFLHTPITLA
jgi:hypothetical protein